MNSFISTEDVLYGSTASKDSIIPEGFEDVCRMEEEVTSTSFGIDMPEHVVQIQGPTPRKFPGYVAGSHCLGSGAEEVKALTKRLLKGSSKIQYASDKKRQR